MSYNVLIVDDSSIVRKVLIKCFGITDIPVANFIQASNGQEALDALEQNWVDVIFLDINMPIMNGLEFLDSLRASKDHKNLPVVVVSTEGSAERRDHMERAGISAYLRKPVSPEQLIDIMEKVFGGIKK
jgi:two-component system chemotaxis response regulator CheY